MLFFKVFAWLSKIKIKIVPWLHGYWDPSLQVEICRKPGSSCQYFLPGLSSRDTRNVRLWHSAEAGLGRLIERVLNVRPNFGWMSYAMMNQLTNRSFAAAGPHLWNNLPLHFHPLWTIAFRVSPVTENAFVLLKISAPSDLLLDVVHIINVLTYLLT